MKCDSCGQDVPAYWLEDPDEQRYLLEPHSCIIGIPPSHLSSSTVGPLPDPVGEAS